MSAEENFPNERLWLIGRIADILTDLGQDEDDVMDPEELLDQMKNVAELLLEGLNTQIIASDGMRCTLLVGD